MNNFLLDCYYEKGTKEEEFEKRIKWIDDHTSYLKRPLRDLVMLSIRYPKQGMVNGAMEAWYLDPRNPIDTVNGTMKLTVMNENKLFGRSTNNLLLKEALMMNPCCVLDKEGKGVLFLSTASYSTFAQRVGLNKSAFSPANLARDLFVASRMNIDGGCTLVVKSFQKAGKIFSVMSENYVSIKLHEICVLYKNLMGEGKLGEMKCEGWEIRHDYVRISFSFPKYSKEISEAYNLKRTLVPCVEFSTSDVGEKSFTVRSYWKTKDGGRIYDQSVVKEHREKVDTDRIEKEVEERIFSKYTVLPEKMAELMTIPVTPEGLDLTKARGQSKNHKAVVAAYKYIFKAIHLSKYLGKRHLMNLERNIDYSMVLADMDYTMYDVVMDVFDFSTKIISYMKDENNFCEDSIEKVNECLSKAAYVDFSKFKPQITETVNDADEATV